MIQPKRAPVRPRVLTLQSTTPLLLDEEIQSFLGTGVCGHIAILGPTGSGKTTALEHLAATLPAEVLEEQVALLDAPARRQLVYKPARLVIYGRSRPFPHLCHLARYQLASWNQDDLIEYLLSVHRPRCGAVMDRIRGDDLLLLAGLPELWRIVLDRLASDEKIPDVRRALHRHLEEHLSDTDLLERARSACLNVALQPEWSLSDTVLQIARPGFADRLIRLLFYPAIQTILASERIAADLHGEASCDYLAKRLPRDLVVAVGRLISFDYDALVHLQRLLAGPPWSHAMTASILHSAGESALLRENCPSQLAGAYLSQVSWPGVQLPHADLRGIDLSAADLRGANLTHCNASKANLHQARLMGSCLNHFVAELADLSDADLSECRAVTANFSSANLRNARFTRARLWAKFADCDLTGTIFRGASLAGADFSSSIIQGADFSGASLSEAILSGLRLSEAHWEGVCFTEAQLEGCDLEYMTLPAAAFEGANLRRALLTGTTMMGATFRGACLREAGLADIEWERADLREADLRGASFHMGSTRSGLVGSTIPCEGSKTGFYTDDYDEQTYKAPEEIRKANLCGADLRGAILDGVDFYLVDLRGALYDDKYADHLRRCGAILEARV
jgi:uncharacterized protein YjbI with pentapeptide repeats/energy-coupling factor transporter ATP-binding protein EcfA2